MTDLEILANFKRAYELIYDVLENGTTIHCNGQFKDVESLKNALTGIEKAYGEMYGEMEKDALYVPKMGNDVKISPDITGLYVDEKGKEIENDRYYYWYNDEQFIM